MAVMGAEEDFRSIPKGHAFRNARLIFSLPQPIRTRPMIPMISLFRWHVRRALAQPRRIKYGGRNDGRYQYFFPTQSHRIYSHV